MLQELVNGALSPLSPEEVSEQHQHWLEALHGAADLAQHVRCGHDALARVASRLREGRKARSVDAGKRGPGSAGSWSQALEDCGRSFVENSAALVEACQGAPPWLAPRVLGCAVRLAEAFGSTGPLLEALDSELAAVEDRVEKLQQLYAVALKRVEAVAGQVPGLEEKAAQAVRARDEIRAQCRDVRQALGRSEKRRLAAESRADELSRELRVLRQQLPTQLRDDGVGPVAAAGFPSPAKASRKQLGPTTISTPEQPGGAESTSISVGFSPAFSSVSPISAGTPPLFCATEPKVEQHGDGAPTTRSGRFESAGSCWSMPAGLAPSLCPTRPPPWQSQPFTPQAPTATSGEHVAPSEEYGPVSRAPADEQHSSAHTLPKCALVTATERSPCQDSTYGGSGDMDECVGGFSVAGMAGRSLGLFPFSAFGGTAGALGSMAVAPTSLHSTLGRGSNACSILWGDGCLEEGTPCATGCGAHQESTAKGSWSLGAGGGGGPRRNSNAAVVLAAGNMSGTAAAEFETSDVLRWGLASASRLPSSEPLAASTQAAFEHLVALVRQARGRHPQLHSPRGQCPVAAVTSALAAQPSEGLRHAAALVELWAAASSELAAADAALAGSIRTSASHLRTLVGLVSMGLGSGGSSRDPTVFRAASFAVG
mmetsp:Transcript_10847/g.38045  ORF Transcript_10847/g.38045 Transcript_10847/m.38045 type:complete len:655 (-) Transcript_10847:52-2016(-)